MLHTLRGLSRRRIAVFLASVSVLIISPFALADIISGNSQSGISDHVTYTQLPLPTPSGSQGDLMLASIAVYDGSSDIVTPPAGWTQIARTDNDVNVTLISYWKIAGSQEPDSYTWLVNDQTRAVGGITRYSGVDPTNPIDTVASNTGFSSTATTTAITTSAANEEVVSLFATNVAKTFSTPTGMNQKYNLSHTATVGPSTAAFDTLQVAAGSTGSTASTVDAHAARYWSAQQIALKRPSPLISYDSGSGAYQQNGTGDQTMPVTLSADDNFLVVGVENGNGQGDTLTGVTWNGTPMVPLGKIGATGEYGYYTYLYGLMNPATGTYNVVTQGAAGGAFVLAAGYKNVGALPTNVPLTQYDSYATSISNSITTVAANAWVIGFGTQNSNPPNSWTGMVSRAADTARSLGDTNGSVAAGNHTFTWGGASSSNWNLMLMEVDPSQ